MMTLILSLLVPLAIGALWHGVSLMIASVLAGEEAPGFFRAMWVSWLGGIIGGGAATVWSFTLGLIVSLFLSSWLSMAIGLGIHVLGTAAIYKKGLKLSGPAAFGVTVIHMILSAAVNLLLGWFSYSMFLA
jgi:hypothetical protein